MDFHSVAPLPKSILMSKDMITKNLHNKAYFRLYLNTLYSTNNIMRNSLGYLIITLLLFIGQNNLIACTGNPPTASFTADITYTCTAPLSVTFFNNSTIGSNLTYLWDFGDGTSISAFGPIHQYVSEGSYDVELIVIDNDTECSDTLLLEDYITIGLEGIQFSHHTIFNGNCNDTEIQFTNTSNIGYESIEWDFGDGNLSSDPNPNHIYTVQGCYQPSLTLVVGGCSNTYTLDDCINVNGPVSASYTTLGDLQGCNTDLGLTVEFFGEAEGAESFLWNFGGEGISNQQNPTFTFYEYGTYPVSMSVTFPDGCSMSTVDAVVELNPLPVMIVPDTTYGCEGLEVNYVGINDSDEVITSWFWFLGEAGAFSTDPSPTHVYDNPGTYGVSLEVITASGCISNILDNNLIQIGEKPTVDFEAFPTQTCAETPVEFVNNSDNVADIYEWDFGDGFTSDEFSPYHEYIDTGSFDIQLIGWKDGCSDTAFIENYVDIIPPAAFFNPIVNCSNTTIEFENLSVGANSWIWDFGDGFSSSLELPTHTYSEPGVYTISLFVTNFESNCSDEFILDVNILTLDAGFSFSDDIICAGDTVEIIQNSVGVDTFEWFFPNSITMIEDGELNANPKFIADYAGSYTGFSLVVKDEYGCSDSYTLNDPLEVSAVTADFELSTDGNCAPVITTFIDNSTSFSGALNNYFWQFGDGNNSSDINPVHTYTDDGTYTVNLVVKNEYGCSDQHVLTNVIEVTQPVADFTYNQTDCNTLEVFFKNISTNNDSGTYIWDFGDGATSFDVNPSHTFSTEGSYEVCLIANTANGCNNIKCETVEFETLTSNFEADNVSTDCFETKFTTQFIDQSNNAVEWAWEFGDGSTSDEQFPVFSYTETGVFTVCLTTTNANGCTQNFCIEDYIEVEALEGSITASVSEACINTDIIFTGESNQEAEFNWDFQNGNNEQSSIDDFIHNATTSFAQTGSYAPELTLVTASGCTTTLTATTSVEVEELVVNFTSTQTEKCETDGIPINFNADYTSSSPIDDIQWSFPGSMEIQSTELNPAGLMYNQEGSYDVTLTLSNELCTSTFTQEDFITVNPSPQAAFSYAPTLTCTEQTISFTDESTISSGSIETWDWQTQEGLMGSEAMIEYTFNDPGNHDVILAVTSDKGCSQGTNQSLNILEGFSTDAGNDQEICQFESTQLEASSTVTGNVTYQWSPAEGLNCTDCPMPMASPESTTTYQVMITSEDGCSSTDEVQITVNESVAPQITLTEDITICAGESVPLEVTGGNSSLNYMWNTTAEGLSCYEGCIDPIATPTETTTYTIYINDGSECEVVDSVMVTVLDNDLDILGEDLVSCEGQPIVLSISTGTNPVWENANTLSCSDCSTPIASPTGNTTYSVSVLTDNGCTIEDEINVSVFYANSIDAGESEVTLCVGESLELPTEFPGQVVWSNEGNILGIDLEELTVYPTESTTYFLNVNAGNCAGADQVSVQVYEDATVFTENYEICEGDTVPIMIETIAEDLYWQLGLGLNDDDPFAPIATPNETQIYTVIGTSSGCENDTAQVEILVNQLPDVTIKKHYNFKENETVTIEASAEGDYTYLWFIEGEASCYDCLTPEIVPVDGAAHELFISNGNGCDESHIITFEEIKLCGQEAIVTPSAFTPNNDGNNDKFYIRGTLDVELLRIYNRWGELIFETTSPSEGWDGTHNGLKLNRDVYVYYTEAVCSQTGKKIVKTGDITLLR